MRDTLSDAGFALFFIFIGFMVGMSMAVGPYKEAREERDECRAEMTEHNRKHANPQARDHFEALSGEYE